jgi:hypothetical protein
MNAFSSFIPGFLLRGNPLWHEGKFIYSSQLVDVSMRASKDAGLEKYLSGIYIAGSVSRMPKSGKISIFRSKPTDLDIGIWMDYDAIDELAKDYLRRVDVMEHSLKRETIGNLPLHAIIWTGHPFFRTESQNSQYSCVWACEDAIARFNKNRDRFNKYQESAYSS